MTHEFYCIEPSYIDLCRAGDMTALSSDITRLYYGPVTYNKQDWYVPYVHNMSDDTTSVYKSLAPERAIPAELQYIHRANVELHLTDEEFEKLAKRTISMLVDLDAHAQECTAVYGIYDIQPEYLSFISNDDINAIAYCGPVIRKNNVNWFAPITKSETEPTKFQYTNGVICNIVHIDRMIPCSDEVLSLHEKTTQETLFCHENKAIIHDLATNAFNRLSDKPYLPKIKT